MIDAVDLIFLQYALDLPVQCFGRIQILAERLFDHNTPPLPIPLRRQSGFSQLLNDGSKKPGRDRQVKKIIALGAALEIYRLESFPELYKSVRVGKIAALVKEPLPEPLQMVFFVIFGRQESSDLVAKFLDTQVIDVNTHHREVVGKELALTRLKSAGTNLRLVKSPAAPNSTNTQGPAAFPAASTSLF